MYETVKILKFIILYLKYVAMILSNKLWWPPVFQFSAQYNIMLKDLIWFLIWLIPGDFYET